MSPPHAAEVRRIAPATRRIRLDPLELFRERALLWTMAAGLMRIRYKQTLARGLWLIGLPALQTAIFVLVFGRWAQLPSEGVPFAPWVLCAIIPWTFFSSALHAATGSLIDNANLLNKVRVSKLVFPTASVLVIAADSSVSVLLFIGIAAAYHVLVVPNLLALTWIALLLFMLSAALGAALACLAAVFRDVRILVPVALQLLFYASPIVYPLSLVPERLRPYYALNPLVALLDGARAGLLRHKPIDYLALAQASVSCLLIALACLALFRVVERTLVDRI